MEGVIKYLIWIKSGGSLGYVVYIGIKDVRIFCKYLVFIGIKL